MNVGMTGMTRRQAATNELERSQRHYKPVALGTWAGPKPHQLEPPPTSAKVLLTAQAADVLGNPTRFPLRHKEARAQFSPYVLSLETAKVVWPILT